MSDMSRAKALKILGLPQFGPAGDIRAAWRTRVFEMHPDRGGSDAELALVNQAYAFLKDEPVRDRAPTPQPAPEPAPERPRGCTPTGKGAPKRPEVQTRLDPISVDDRAVCEAKLGADGTEAGHVPGMVRRRGRRVSYFVDTPLHEGHNRVVLPTQAPTGTRRTTAKVVNFATKKSGSAEINVPDATRESLFPGAKSVRLHFARTN